MQPSTIASASAPSGEHTLPAALIFLLALGAGLSVASIYYNQPMLGIIGEALGASSRKLGLLPTLTQLGYACGLLFFAPLGDRYDRRRIILGKAAMLCLALLLAAMAPGIEVLLMASFAIGLTATLAQDIVPAAATLAPVASRGKAVGTVMTGLLLGILLSRTISGLVAEYLGWRDMFSLAALSIALLAVALWRGLPSFVPTTRLSYRALLGSLLELWRIHPGLRRAALAQGLLAIGFSAFWSTLAVMLHAEPFHLGAAAAGAFGLAGAAGALAAPIAGRLADCRGPQWMTRVGASVVVASFAVMLAGNWLSPTGQLALLAIGALGFDLGVQATLVAHQTIIYGLDPAARSRLNAVLMVSMFVGMALGASLGSLLLANGGWAAVIALALVAALAALGLRLLPAGR